MTILKILTSHPIENPENNTNTASEKKFSAISAAFGNNKERKVTAISDIQRVGNTCTKKEVSVTKNKIKNKGNIFFKICGVSVRRKKAKKEKSLYCNGSGNDGDKNVGVIVIPSNSLLGGDKTPFPAKWYPSAKPFAANLSTKGMKESDVAEDSNPFAADMEESDVAEDSNPFAADMEESDVAEDSNPFAADMEESDVAEDFNPFAADMEESDVAEAFPQIASNLLTAAPSYRKSATFDTEQTIDSCDNYGADLNKLSKEFLDFFHQLPKKQQEKFSGSVNNAEELVNKINAYLDNKNKNKKSFKKYLSINILEQLQSKQIKKTLKKNSILKALSNVMNTSNSELARYYQLTCGKKGWQLVAKTQEPKIQERESETKSRIKDLPPSTSTSVNKVALTEVISTETAVIKIAPVTNEQQQINTLIDEYNERVVSKYKGDKDIKLNDGITSLNELCQEINKHIDKIRKIKKSTLRVLIEDFVQEITKKPINPFGVMSDFPYHLYPLEEAKQVSKHQLLFTEFLKGYINNNSDRHLPPFKKILKEGEIQKYAVIELENKTNVIVRTFPENNRDICNLLNILSQHHTARRTWARDLAVFLEESELAAFMKIEPLQNEKHLQIVPLEDDLKSVNKRIEELTSLMRFMGNAIPHINSELANLNQANHDDGQNAQLTYYRMTQIFSGKAMRQSNGAKKWAYGVLRTVVGKSNTDFGDKTHDIHATVNTLIDRVKEKTLRKSNSASIINSDQYKKMNARLKHIAVMAGKWKSLKGSIANDITENIDTALRHAIAADIIQLKHELKSINLNTFLNKGKWVLAGIITGTILSLATLSSLAIIVVLPLSVIGGIFGLAYLITKCKPKIEPSQISKILSDSVKKIINQDFGKLESHDVSWSDAIKYWRKGILPIAVVQQTNQIAALPAINTPLNTHD
ncbi:hypothetical protein [Candidatus Fukatsuia endosymbiont of Tuberolachnus salignus]|uniref:hypothetical protein n=1 Tax=Candidatus Fukatsuia endosymbiont of Tuberolachnus salignus TaxID=3077957 RepID=UPI00313B4FF9